MLEVHAAKKGSTNPVVPLSKGFGWDGGMPVAYF